MQNPDRVGRGVVGSEGIRADQLGQMGSVVRSRRSDRPHFMQNHRDPGIRRLPRGFRTGQSSADDVDRTHGRACHKALRHRQRVLSRLSVKGRGLEPALGADAPLKRRVSALSEF